MVQETYSIEWHIDDVHERRPDLTDEQASHVLYKLCDPSEHDACLGVNWDTIDSMCDVLYGDAPEEDN